MTPQQLIKQGKELFDKKKYPEAIDKLNEALGSIADKTQHIQEQINAQFLLGRCYLEQAIKTSDAQTAKPLFDDAIKSYTTCFELAKQITDKQKRIEHQVSAQSWLGRCYLEQAIKTSDAQTAKPLFDDAIKSYTTCFELAKQITDKQKRIEHQVSAQSWLGRCYLEHAIKTADEKTAKSLFDKAIKHCTKWFELATQLTDKQKRIEQQVYAEYSLGRCYLEQAMKTSNKETATLLFDNAIEYHTKELELAKQLTDEQKRIEEQVYAQSWLGRCYLEQAIKTSNTQTAKPFFDKAIEHNQERLKLAIQLTNKQKRIEKQGNAQSLLGRCYLEQAIKTSNKETATLLFDNAIEYHTKELELAKQLTDEQKRIEEQVYAQSWLGRCYLEQAIKTSNTQTAKPFFDKAIEHNQERLKLAIQLTNKQKSIEKQGNAQSLLGRCYLEQAIKTSDAQTAKPLFDDAIKSYTTYFELAKQLTDEQKRIEQQVYAEYSLGRCCFEQAIKTSDEQEVTLLFKEAIQHKVNYTHQTLFERSTNKHQKSVSEILASLSISPFEASNTTFAHYTNPHVTELLFGLADNSPKAMRMNSATYMNDPYEGKSLFEFLGIPEASLENITEFPKYNAFFSCFSHRVNDLNQFRLYGKEDGVEASGCCLVFNKNRKWLKQIDIAKSFSSMKNEREIGSPISSSEKNYSLYQIAYIAYLDDYIDRNKCEIITTKPDEKFAIYLPKVGNSDEWHRIRVEKLKKALKDLREEISKTNNEIEKQDLEYIRYLFKDFAFRDEEEFRILTLKEIGKETECCDKTNSVFVPYADISNMVDEVILGTNYEKTNQKRKVEVFRHKMKEHFPDVKITHSSLPINANPPRKKDS